MNNHLCRLAFLVVIGLSSTANAQLRITEFLADNATGIVDEDGEVSDWIEIHNASNQEQRLQGWSITDSAKDARKWSFPDIGLGADAYLVVFASGKDRRKPNGALHTNFKLEKRGEYLGLTSPTGSTLAVVESKYPKQRQDVAYGIPVGPGGEVVRDAAVDYLAFPTPGRANTTVRIGQLATIELSQPHGLFKAPFQLSIRAADPDVTVRYTTDGRRPRESSAKFEGPIDIQRTTVIRAAGYKLGYAPTPIVTRTYIFPEDRIDDSADGLPPENYPYDWGAGRSNYGMDANITRDPQHRAKLLDALWGIPSYSLLIETENLFSDAMGIYAHAGWHGRKAERRCSLELLPTADGREKGFQIEAGVRMRGGSSRRPQYQKHAFRLFFRKQYGQSKLAYDLFGGDGAQQFDCFDLRCSQQYSWHHGFNARALYIRDQFSRDLQLAMGHPAARGNFRHLYINGHYWGLFNTCERPEASFGSSYIGGKKSQFDVVKIMGGYSEDNDQERHYQVSATDGDMQLWRRLNRLSQRDLSDLNNYRELIGVKPDGSRDPQMKRLIDPVNLIDYMLVIFYTGNLDTSISWFGNNRGANNWHGLINRKNSQGFQFIIWDAEHTLLDLIEDRLGPFPMSREAERDNPTWLYQRLLDSNEFRVLLADRICQHLFHDGVLTPPQLTRLFDQRIAEIEPGLFAEAARWGNPRKTFESSIQGAEFRVETHNSGVAKHAAWFHEIRRTREEYIPRRTQIVIDQLFGRGLYPDLPEIEAKLSSTDGVAKLELAAGKLPVYYTTDGQDPRKFGGEVHSTARVYEGPLTLAAGERVVCRVLVDKEWGPVRSFAADDLRTQP